MGHPCASYWVVLYFSRYWRGTRCNLVPKCLSEFLIAQLVITVLGPEFQRPHFIFLIQRDPKLSLDAVPYPFTLSQLLPVQGFLKGFVGWLLPVLMTQFSQVVVPYKSPRCFFLHPPPASLPCKFSLFMWLCMCAIKNLAFVHLCQSWSHEPWKGCDVPGRRWLEVIKGSERVSGVAACCF